MSKRHTFEQSGGEDPTLVFYAPLTEGDFYDHISGIEMQSGTGTITWDSNKAAYHFLQASNNRGVVGYWDGLNLDIDIEHWGITMVAEYAAVNNGTDETKYRCVDIGGLQYPLYNTSGRCMVNPPLHLANYGTTTKEMHKLAIKWATSGQAYLFAQGYRSNEWKKPEEVYASWTGLSSQCNIFKRDTNVSDDWIKTRVSIGRCQGSPQVTNIWVRNIRIYNRELTVSEIISL